jgi:hypothetical protein
LIKTDSPILVPAKHASHLDDLIFCPLDLPAVPLIDPESFVDWMKADPFKTGEYPKAHYERIVGKTYPWLMRSLQGDLTSLGSTFPAVMAHCQLYPFSRIRNVIFLAQNGHQSVFTHTDSDGLVGMRFYLVNKSTEGLHFYRGKEPYDYFNCYPKDQQGNPYSANLPDYFDMSQKTYALFPEGVRSFMLNSARAAHGIDSNTCRLGDRIAVLVQGELDRERYRALMDSSLKKYGEYAIWY